MSTQEAQQIEQVASADELRDRGKRLDAAIAGLRLKVNAREAEDWQLRRRPRFRGWRRPCF